MRVLIIKLSSMGDVIHTLPAITDAMRANPELEFDWLVEAGFQDIPKLHPQVKNVIPIELRKWRKKPIHYWRNGEIKTCLRKLRETQYDLVIDAQGLIKSALLARLAKGKTIGLDRHSAREPAASIFYKKTININRNELALNRTRQLFAQALNYPLPNTEPDCNIDLQQLSKAPINTDDNYLVFLTGTTWKTKHWPESYWQELIQLTHKLKTKIYLPWGNKQQQIFSEQLAQTAPFVYALPECSLSTKAKILAQAKAVVSVDTGLGHLASAVNTPTLMLFGPTNPNLLRMPVKIQYVMQANFSCAPCSQRQCTYQGEHAVEPPCFATVTPTQVFNKLQDIIKS
jgi:heptosyltransferase I